MALLRLLSVPLLVMSLMGCGNNESAQGPGNDVGSSEDPDLTGDVGGAIGGDAGGKTEEDATGRTDGDPAGRTDGDPGGDAGGKTDAGPGLGKVVYVAADGSGDFNCDGKADQVEINQALQYAKKNGFNTVYLKPGTCIINGTIEIPDGLTFTGPPAATVKLVANWSVTTANMFTPMITGTRVISGIRQKGGSKITISGFTLDGDRWNQSAIIKMKEVDSFPGIQFYYSDHLTIKNMVIKDIAGDGIRLNNGRKSGYGYHAVLNNKIYDTGHDDVYIQYGNHDVVDGNTLSHVAADCGVRLDDSSNMKVTNNVIWADSKSLYGVSGIYLLKHGNDADCYNVEIAYNLVYDTREMGIVLAMYADNMAATSARDVHIHHNVIHGAGSNYRIGYPYGGGIWLDAWSNTIIENNVIDRSMGDGIAYGNRFPNVNKTATYTTYVRNNIITNTVDSPVLTNDGYGINNRLGSNYRFVLENNLVWNNVAGNYRNVGSPASDINKDPLYANATSHDYHLKSSAGRWTANGWVLDPATSPCIDAGKPGSDHSKEPPPNGGRINIGRYGNTAEASKSP